MQNDGFRDATAPGIALIFLIASRESPDGCKSTMMISLRPLFLYELGQVISKQEVADVITNQHLR